MRYLFLTMGAPGAGKSTWIKENKLKEYTLSSDNIRLMLESPRINPNGDYYISQKNDKRVWELLFEILEERMKRGELIIVDATHSRPKLINRYKKLAKKYRYRVIVIDFTNISLEELIKRNRNRGYRSVPESAIKNIYQRLYSMRVPGWIDDLINPEHFKDKLNILYDWNNFDNVVFIGDIHGNFDEFVRLWAKILELVNSETAFVFLGDYFDRGNQNAKTFNFLYELMFDDNFYTIFLTGNHDYKWLPRYKEFLQGEFIGRKPPYPTIKTYEEFKEAGISYKDVERFYWKLGQLVHVKFGDYVLTATHGGIPVIPTIFTPTEDFIMGVGNYEDSEIVDKTWNLRTPQNYYSIHGHRNIFNVPIHNTNRTFNLNGNAEYINGELRALIVTKDGKFIELTQKAIGENKLSPKKRNKITESIEEGKLLEAMMSHKFVTVKQFGNIYSCNFSRKAFRNKIWDTVTLKARGLFIQKIDDKEFIVARGYNKFFNLNEREETRLQNLTSAEFPANVYLKYNGFLGLLSINKETGEFLITTKGSIQGDYVEMFKELITPHLTEELKNYIKSTNTTLVFEVIHHKDPHIVDYNNKDFIILLDIIYNEIEEKKLPYVNLIHFGYTYHFEVKEKLAELKNYKELYEFVNNMEKQEILTNEGIEGVVIEFNDNFKVKVKTNWYRFWKSWRSKKFAIQKIKDTAKEKHSRFVQFAQGLHTYEDNLVFQWIKNYSENLFEEDIITLRKKFLENFKEE